jgi:glycosyltransferase involved in cell wall biosynthesis
MSIRVLLCPTDTGRNAWTLAQAEKRLGLESTVLVYHSTWLNYPNDIDLRMRERGPLGKMSAVGRLVARAARDFDVIHFNGGRSLMPSSPGTPPWLSSLDLAYFRALGKAIVVTYQGCEVRQKMACERLFGVQACSYCTAPCDPVLDDHKARMVHGFDRYADAIYALNPDLLNVLPERAEFLPYTTIEPGEWEPVPLPATSHRFTILHAPTNRGLKGTDCILAAVDALRKRHPEVELVLVEKVPHDQVRALYASADLVIDQVLLGWYGGLAVEAMALGRPVVCYIRDEDLRFVPEPMRSEIPVIRATPDTLLAVLQDALAHRERLGEIGALSRAYVERWHDPLAIATRTKAEYLRILASKRGAA